MIWHVRPCKPFTETDGNWLRHNEVQSGVQHNLFISVICPFSVQILYTAIVTKYLFPLFTTRVTDIVYGSPGISCNKTAIIPGGTSRPPFS